MKPKRLQSITSSGILLSIAVVAVFFTGCTPGRLGLRNMTAVSRYFDADVNTVWNAVDQAMTGIQVEIKDMEKGLLRTQWIKGWSTTKSTGLITGGEWQERYRLTIQVTGEQAKTYVSMQAQLEEKAPGGSRAYRWSRTVSDGTIERDYLQRIEKILNVP
ncbi:MAG: hypothetical protein B6D35_06550 [Candidatus Brocadia sp. UTAMX2]|jgi:hypothetical protein|nr:MAG: hypothetical protein B6D35_06550 [Candidatus Brocadia sp. UTAMX2]